jgi:hypothetical protein
MGLQKRCRWVTKVQVLWVKRRNVAFAKSESEYIGNQYLWLFKTQNTPSVPLIVIHMFHNIFPLIVIHMFHNNHQNADFN